MFQWRDVSIRWMKTIFLFTFLQLIIISYNCGKNYPANEFSFQFARSAFQISCGWSAGLFVYIFVCDREILFQNRVITFHINSEWNINMFIFLSIGINIVNWMTTTRKSVEHLRTLYGNSCTDLIRSHQQCIPSSPPLDIEPATTDCSAETLQQFISHIRHAKSSSDGNCAAK